MMVNTHRERKRRGQVYEGNLGNKSAMLAGLEKILNDSDLDLERGKDILIIGSQAYDRGITHNSDLDIIICPLEMTEAQMSDLENKIIDETGIDAVIARSWDEFDQKKRELEPDRYYK